MRETRIALATLAFVLAVAPAALAPRIAQAATFDSSWTAITSAQNITKGGKYYLANDVAFDTFMDVAALSADVTLDLNGHAITFNAPSGKTDSGCVFVRANTNLVVQDSEGGGKIAGGFGFYDPGEESWSGGGVHVDYGTLTLKSGTIADCKARGGGDGGGVYVDDGGSFTMEGGTIENCEAGSGGGVYVHSRASFTMEGGTIENCGPGSIGGSGGGVCVGDNGSFTMRGGAIQNCIADNGGGVIVNGGATFTMRTARVEAPPVIKGSKDYRGNASSDVVLWGGWANQTLATMYDEGGTVEGEVYMPQLATIDHRADAAGYTRFNGNVKTGSHKVTIADEAKLAVVFQADAGTPATQTLRVLNGQKLDTMPQDPVRATYAFAGWKRGTALGTEVPFDFDAPVTQGLGQFAHASWSQDIADAVVEIDRSTFTYNGESQGPQVTRVHFPSAGASLVSGTDYNVSGQTSAVLPGTYTLQVEGYGQVLGGTSQSVPWTIVKADQTINAEDVVIPYGTTTAKVGASVSGRAAKDGPGNLSYEVTQGADIVSVAADGAISTLGTLGTATVRISAAGDDRYNTAPDKEITVRVDGDVEPTISSWPYVSGNTKKVYVNDELDIGDLEPGTAVTPGSFSIAGPHSWDSSGPQQIQIRFTPDDPNYKTVEKTETNFVVWARPVLRITSPAQTLHVADMLYGTALEDLGLPATATIEAGDEGNKKEYTVPLSWKSASGYIYDSTSLQTQSLTGTLDLSAISNEVTNSGSVAASAKVTLQKLLPGDAVFADKEAVYSGAPIAHELESLPEGAQSASYTYEGTADTSYPATSEAPTLPGTYRVTATFTARHGYETPIDATAALTIEKKAATVRAIDREAKVGDAAPNLNSPVIGTDYAVEGLVAGDALGQGITVKLAYANEPDMGKEGAWPIEATVEGSDARYDLTAHNGTLTVRANGGSGGGDEGESEDEGEGGTGGGQDGGSGGNDGASGVRSDGQNPSKDAKGQRIPAAGDSALPATLAAIAAIASAVVIAGHAAARRKKNGRS